MQLDFSKNINIKSLFPENEFEEKVIFLKIGFLILKPFLFKLRVLQEFRKSLKSKKENAQFGKMTCDF